MNFLLNNIAEKNNKSFNKNEDNIYDLIEDIVIILDKKGTINYLSPSSKKVFGSNYTELFGKPIQDISKELHNKIKNYSESDKNIILLKIFDGSKKLYQLKSANNKKINRHVVLLKEIEEKDPENSFSLKDVKLLEKHFQGVIIKLEVNDDQIMKVHHASENIVNITGYSTTEIKKNSKHFVESIHPKDLHSFRTLIKKTDKELLPIKMDLTFLRENKIIDTEFAAIPYKKSGEVLWIASIIEKKLSKDSENLELFKSAFDHVSEGIIITSVENDNPIIYVNDQFLKETGYLREEILGRNPRIFQGKKTDPATVKAVRTSLQKKEQFRGEIINYRKDGTTFHNLMTINPVRNEQNEVTHYIGVQSNIDYRIKVEEELKEHIERFALISKATNDVIWDWDLLQNKLTWPSDLETTYGFQKSELYEDPNWQFEQIHPEDQNRVHKSLYETLKRRRNFWHEEYRFRNANGDYLYLTDKAYIVYDKKDNPVKMIGAKQNITALKKLLEIQTNLAKELSYKNKDLSQFAYIVSHNFRSPIARLKGLVNLLEEPENLAPEETRVILKHINSMAENLDETIKDLSEILQSRRSHIENHENVDLRSFFEKVEMVLQDQILISEAEININFEEAPFVFTLKGYLFSILTNLLSNAIKYRSSSRKLKIEVSSRKENSFVVIEVKDNGIGINLKKQKDKIFGLYKRFHPHIEGKGIGLYLVKTQAETMGGKVEVESRENEGTTFRIYFKSL